MLHDLRKHQLARVHSLLPRWILIAGSQTLLPRFKSVTGKIMKKRFQFIGLRAVVLENVGTLLMLSLKFCY